MIMSTHVDDMKGASKRKVAQARLDHILKTVGDCTVDYNKFVNTGVQRVHTHQEPTTHTKSRALHNCGQ